MPVPQSDRRLPIVAAALLLVCWFGFLAFSYHGSFPPGTLPHHVVILLAASSILVAAAGYGGWLLRLVVPSLSLSPLSAVLAAGLGFGVIELATLVALSTHIACSVTAWSIVGLGVAAALLRFGGWTAGGEAVAMLRDAAARWWGIPAMALAVMGWLAALAAALAPAEFYDALIYHLAVPDLHVSRNSMGAVEGNFYAQFPANQGMLYALGILLVRDRIAAGALAQVLHVAAGALAILATFAAGARHLSPRVGLLGAVLLATVPGVLLVATAPIADLAVTLNGALVIAALLEAHASAGGAEARRWILLGGLFAGLAFGTKYTAALSVVLPATAWLAWRVRKSGREGLADLAAFVLVTAAIFAPWGIRNAVLSGNPLAPYMSGVFGAQESGPTLTQEVTRRLPNDAGWRDLAAHYLGAAWRVNIERLGAGGYLGMAFALLIPFLALRGPRPRALSPLAVIAATAVIGWSLSVQIARYLFPVLPALALLAAQGAAHLARAVPRLRGALACALGWIVFHNLYLFAVLIATISPYGAVLGIEAPEEYLARRVSYYPAAAWVNRNLPPGSRILLVGEGRGYYLERPYAASTPFDPILIERFADESTREGRPLAETLRRAGYTHLIASRGEMDRVAAMSGLSDYFGRTNPVARGAIRSLLSGDEARILFERAGVSVIEIPGR